MDPSIGWVAMHLVFSEGLLGMWQYLMLVYISLSGTFGGPFSVDAHHAVGKEIVARYILAGEFDYSGGCLWLKSAGGLV